MQSWVLPAKGWVAMVKLVLIKESGGGAEMSTGNFGFLFLPLLEEQWELVTTEDKEDLLI